MNCNCTGGKVFKANWIGNYVHTLKQKYILGFTEYQNEVKLIKSVLHWTKLGVTYGLSFCRSKTILDGSKGVQSMDGNSSENFTTQGIEESRNGNLTFLRDLFLGVLGEFWGNEIFLDLHAYYKKSQYIFFILCNFQKFPVKSQIFWHILIVPMYEWGKVKKVPGSKIAASIYSWQGCEFSNKSWFSNFEILEEFGEDL